MLRTRTALVLTFFALTALAGCISEDTPPTTDDLTDKAADPLVTKDTGSVTGQVVTVSLDWVEGAQVSAKATAGGAETKTVTDAEGRFTINQLEPGKYRITISDACCKAALKEVDIKANQVTEIAVQIEQLTAADLGQPYQEYESWTGFMACGVGTLAATWSTCSTLEDPNQDFLHRFNVTEGLQELVVGIDWTPVGGVSGTKLWVVIERNNCDVTCEAGDTYWEETDADPGTEGRVTDGPGDLDFDNFTGEHTIQVRVFPGGDANVMYQQPFTLHWHEFYNAPAPEDFNPFPDA